MWNSWDSLSKAFEGVTSHNAKSLFISHASEDKKRFVRPLASTLRKKGVPIWYDEYELRPGDSISKGIDIGLNEADFGVLVLSRSFFKKYWTNEEVSGLRALQSSGKIKKIIPIWLGVTQEEVLKFSPILADKIAIVSSPKKVPDAAQRILATVMPNLASISRAQDWFRDQEKNAVTINIPVEDLDSRVNFIVHKEFSDQFLSRIRLVNSIFQTVFLQTFEQAVDSFQRDLNPHLEIIWWEYLAFFFISITNIIGHDHDEKLYFHLFGFLMGAGSNDLDLFLSNSEFSEFKGRFEIFFASANDIYLSSVIPAMKKAKTTLVTEADF